MVHITTGMIFERISESECRRYKKFIKITQVDYNAFKDKTSMPLVIGIKSDNPDSFDENNREDEFINEAFDQRRFRYLKG